MKRLAMCCLTAAVAGLSGCENYGGGASVVPQVTVLPADTASADTASAGTDSGAATTAAGGNGTLSGRIVLTGAAPALVPLIKQGAEVKDKEVCSAVDLPDERLVLGADNGVANVFVYLPRAPKGTARPTPSPESVVFDQKNCRFFPHCLLVPVGQNIKVLSQDTVAHNTHTNPLKGTSVNSLVSAMDREGKLVFAYTVAEAAPVAVTCDFHTWMKAYQLPLDHSFAALSDENGKFTIPDLPAGKHSFVVWHEAADGNYIERKLAVEIKPGETTDLTIEYPAAKLKL